MVAVRVRGLLGSRLFTLGRGQCSRRQAVSLLSGNGLFLTGRLSECAHPPSALGEEVYLMHILCHVNKSTFHITEFSICTFLCFCIISVFISFDGVCAPCYAVYLNTGYSLDLLSPLVVILAVPHPGWTRVTSVTLLNDRNYCGSLWNRMNRVVWQQAL